MKQPNNTFTIRIGNQNPTQPNPLEPTIQNKNRANLNQTSERNPHDVSKLSNVDKESDITSEATIDPQLSLIEQVRARKKQAANEKTVNQQVNNEQVGDQHATNELPGSSRNSAYVILNKELSEKRIQEQDYYLQRNVTSNYTHSRSTQANKSGKIPIKHLITKKGKTSGLAAVLGIIVGVLLGIGAYFLFTGVAKPPNGNAVGMSQNGKDQDIAVAASGAQDTNGDAQKQANNTTTVSAANTGTETLLGPGGATSGTTVYLYQIGIFSEVSALNKQMQTLKDYGIPSFQRGSQPSQLVVGASSTKSGIDGMNKLLQATEVEYYMKPFIVPNVPDKIGSLSNTEIKDIQKALQDEWGIAEDVSNQDQTNELSAVAQHVKNALRPLPTNYKQAVQDIEGSLNDLQQIQDSVSASSSGTDQVKQQCYWLGKFYSDYAQGVADLQS